MFGVHIYGFFLQSHKNDTLVPQASVHGYFYYNLPKKSFISCGWMISLKLFSCFRGTLLLTYFRFHVEEKVIASFEPRPTFVTGIRPFARVLFLVPFQTLQFTEFCPTYFTGMRFLPCVSSHVAFNSAFFWVCFPAYFTRNRFPTLVYFPVTVKNRAVTKRFPTYFTNIRLLIGVSGHVDGQIVFMTETFSTYITGKQSFWVNCLMDIQCSTLTETFPTCIAGIRSLTCVGSHMATQSTALIKTFPTCMTRIWFLTCVKSHVDSQIGSTKFPPTYFANKWIHIGMVFFPPGLILRNIRLSTCGSITWTLWDRRALYNTTTSVSLLSLWNRLLSFT